MKEFKRIVKKTINKPERTFTEKDYYGYVNYLKNKYGPVPEPYFKDKECTKKNVYKNKYKKEKYISIHHIKECEKGVDDLGKAGYAARFPYEYQLPENLVYCNLLEHILLHLMLNHLRGSITGGERFMLCVLFDMVCGYEFKVEYREKEKQQLISYFEDFEDFEDFTIALAYIAFYNGGEYMLNWEEWIPITADFIVYLDFLSKHIKWIKEEFKPHMLFINRIWKYNKNISYYYHLERLWGLLSLSKPIFKKSNVIIEQAFKEMNKKSKVEMFDIDNFYNDLETIKEEWDL